MGRKEGSIDQQILRVAVNTVSKKVDCLGLITLPGRYRAALSGTKNSLATILAALLNTDYDPFNQLIKLDAILAATKLRVIIFLEDIDRNPSEDMIKNEMPSLLDRLRKLESVSFVLAIATERELSQILVRICDHMESLI